MQHCRAFPANRLKNPNIRRQQEINRAGKPFLIVGICQHGSISLTPSDYLERTRQRISSRRDREDYDPPRHPAQQQSLARVQHDLAHRAID